jgi:hypothetical protein
MGNHIFLSNADNFKVCCKNGVYGGTYHTSEKINAEVIASLEAVRPRDLIFFYVTKVGIHGLWKATRRVFFDDTDIGFQGNPGQRFPYRVCLEPCIRQFAKPVSMSDVLDLRDKGKMWTFDLGAITRKNHYPITEEEGKELIRLLLRNNPISQPVVPLAKPYQSRQATLPLKFETDGKGQLKFEGYLNAWFMQSFAQGRLKGVFGEYRDFLNYVPTSFNTVMDIFLTHVTTVDSVDILHKFSCIELKTGICTEDDLNQIIKYENWLVRKIASGDNEMVQSILVAFDFQDKVLEYVQRRRKIEEKTVRLLKYQVSKKHDDITISEVDVDEYSI